MEETTPYLRMLYLRREYARLHASAHDLHGCFVLPESCSAADGDVWRGILFVRDRSSPWARGAFAFTITFPKEYPFACPTLVFDQPILSNSELADNRRRVIFELEFMSTRAMQESVLARLLRLARRNFTESDNNFENVNRSAAHADVLNCSVTLDEAAPYRHLFDEDAVLALVELEKKRRAGSDIDALMAHWHIAPKAATRT